MLTYTTNGRTFLMNRVGPRILIIIPAYNEEKSIGVVVKSILCNCPGVTVLVVDDGSMDYTALQAKAAGAKVISLPQNLGIGGAMQTGYLYAFYNDFDIAIQIDADGQHKSEELSKLLEPLKNNEADLVLGSRYIEKTTFKSTLGRRIGMVVLSTLVSVLARQRIYDTTSGFRGVNAKVIKLFAKEYSTDYPEVDSLVLVRKNGLRIKEVPVEMEQRLAGKSSITPMKSAYYMTKVSLALFIRSMR
jgi:glycosyltransferase involved in cell wall biosynthesis